MNQTERGNGNRRDKIRKPWGAGWESSSILLGGRHPVAERTPGYGNGHKQDRWKHLMLLLEHEMRSPLAAALMQLSVVEHAMRGAGSMERAHVMLSGAKRQIFGLSQVMRRVIEIQTHGRIDLFRETLDLGKLVIDLVTRLRCANPVLWSRVEVRVAEPVTGSWDPSAIEQICENLLSNALKFSKDGPVCLSVARARGGVRLAVKDQGVGIAPEDQEKIFGLFTRAASTQAVAGQGIGLWVVRHLVQAHSGRIQVTSKKGTGTVFEVLLPLASPRSPRRTRRPTTVSSSIS
jgi:signal transduction histidine kinase